MGIGNLQNALRAYGDDDVSYARLYFDSTPLEHAGGVPPARRARRRLVDVPVARRGGARDHAPVPHRPGAARSHLGAAEREELRRGGAAPGRRDRALRDARAAARRLRRRPDRRAGRARGSPSAACRSTPGWASSRARLGRSRTLYRGLREPALALLDVPRRGRQADLRPASRSSSRAPCATSATSACSCAATARRRANYSLHTTGWAFDILRSYALARAGAGVRVHARSPAVARPHRVGARAGGDPRHGLRRRDGAGAVLGP